MSNSSLAEFTAISPNRTSPRNHAIDTITIHCYVGQVTLERMAKGFSNPAKKASCNYGIDLNGRIGLFVDEGDRSWCSSSSSNDNRAITIECASDSYAPYAINDKVYASLIKLCADICSRNGISELKWQADKNLIGQVEKQNVTVHRWFANKSCPGAHIYSRLGQIAKDINLILSGTSKWESFSSFKVRIKATQLKIRNGPGTSYRKVGIMVPGVYTIVDKKDGIGSKAGWGLLKSKSGWISLDYAERIS